MPNPANKLRSFYIAAVIAIVLTACRDTTSVVPDRRVDRIAVTVQTSGPVFAGDSVHLRAVAYTPTNGVIRDAAFTWSVSDPSIASVNANGTVHMQSAGTAIVTATSQGVTGSVQVSTSGTPLITPQTTQSIVASGRESKCAISAQQDVYCWGWNGHGGNILLPANPSSLLGTGDTLSEIVTPKRIAGNLKFIDVASTEESLSMRCGVAVDRAVYCWGQLPWIPELFAVPTRVPGAVQFSALSGGGYHLCGVDTAGDVYCWGDNRYGQSGTAPSPAFDTPRKVTLPEQMVSVAAGGWITCALSISGRIYCWGIHGVPPGSAGPAESFLPRVLTTPTLFARLDAVGSDFCALDRAGALYCWKSEPNQVPVPISFTERFKSISMGGSHNCGVAADDVGYCWGSNNAGQLGNGSTVSGGPPARASTNQSFLQLSAGGGATCGITTSHELYCWGSRAYGQVGDGMSHVRRTPVQVAGGPFVAISAYHRQPQCGLTAAGQAFCWGGNDRAQLGDGTTTSRHVPTPVATNARFTSVTSDRLQTCGLTADSIAYCWGPSNPNVQTVSALVPTAVATSVKFASVSPGWQHVCGLSAAGDAYCWGNGHMGSLGAGNFASSASPQLVSGGYRFAQLFASFDYTCGLTLTGQVYCWGASPVFSGPGVSTCMRFSSSVPCVAVPQRVSGLPAIRDISPEFCGIGFNEDLYCWNATTVHAFTGIRAAGFAGMGTAPLDPVARMRVRDVNGKIFAIGETETSFGLVEQNFGMNFTALAGQCGISNGITYCWGNSLGVGDGVLDYVTLPQRIAFP